MTIQRITSAEVTEPAPHTWSNCLKVGDTVYVAGLTARDKQLKPVGGGEYEQSRLIFERIRHLVLAAGGSTSDVVKINIYMTRIGAAAGTSQCPRRNGRVERAIRTIDRVQSCNRSAGASIA
ncbi:RidA family protein [Burkholderia sp. 22PA0106]|uniref:RidA family protein n=1 Tax=Burkholderia sp. 22PA0106 TaxID=3237371 RepID=UPI0039C2B09B